MAKLKIQKTNTVANPDITVDSYVSPTLINGNHIGGTGGDNSQTVPTIQCSFLRDVGGAVDTGYIIFQKGMRKFEVNNTSDANTTVATLVNKLSSELTAANTMVITATTATITGANVANIGANIAQNGTTAYVTFAAGNVTGVATPAVGTQINGTSLTGNVTVTTINSATNVTVSFSSQVVSDEQADISSSFSLSRISNKYAWDWNNNKYRYWFAAPQAGSAGLSSQPTWQGTTFVQVAND